MSKTMNDVMTMIRKDITNISRIRAAEYDSAVLSVIHERILYELEQSAKRHKKYIKEFRITPVDDGNPEYYLVVARIDTHDNIIMFHPIFIGIGKKI